MGYIEIFRIDDEGAGWVDLSEATPDELFNIELGLLNEGALFDSPEALQFVGGLGYNRQQQRKENYD